MKIKRYIAAALAGVCFMNLIAGSAAAHSGEIRAGWYVGKNQNADLLIRLESSAITSLLTYDDVYKYGTDWNGISSKAKVTVLKYTPGMPTLAGEIPVSGMSLGEGKFGETLYYNSKGEPTLAILDWGYVAIHMNNSPNAFSEANDETEGARKTFIHEVGHALKLAHPVNSTIFEDHDYNGLPYAVMNQRMPYVHGNWISPGITAHDRQCLIDKWGA